MTTHLRMIALAVAALMLAGCNTAEKYQKNAAATRAWLAAQTLRARVDIAGSWYSDDWGHAYFTQSGRSVSGHLGEYPVTGVVSGSRAYLAVSQGNWTYYTAIVSRTPAGQLEGFYSYSVPFSVEDQRVLTLRPVR